MEETGITIHNGLPRRNIFLRENPMSCRFAASAEGFALRPQYVGVPAPTRHERR